MNSPVDPASRGMMDYNIITFMSSLGIEVNDAELLWKLVAGAEQWKEPVRNLKKRKHKDTQEWFLDR